MSLFGKVQAAVSCLSSTVRWDTTHRNQHADPSYQTIRKVPEESGLWKRVQPQLKMRKTTTQILWMTVPPIRCTIHVVFPQWSFHEVGIWFTWKRPRQRPRVGDWNREVWCEPDRDKTNGSCYPWKLLGVLPIQTKQNTFLFLTTTSTDKRTYCFSWGILQYGMTQHQNSTKGKESTLQAF